MIIKTDYSLFKSSIKIEDAIKAAKGFLILADDNISATPTFVYACRKAGIKPIIGVEKEIGGAKYLFIALNYEGLHLLIEMESTGYNDTIFSNENIVTVMSDLLNTDLDIVNVQYGLKTNTNVDIILGQYVEKVLDVSIVNGLSDTDFYKLSMISAVGNGTSMEKSAVKVNYNQNPGNISELDDIVNKAVDDFKFGNPVPPTFKFLNEVSAEEGIVKDNLQDQDLFRHLCLKGLKKRMENIPAEYIQRLEFEMDVINKMNFAGYFLIVWDFVNYAKSEGIPVGPGRGSAAGSLVAYSLGITDLDPIPNGLLFERFLNPDRVSFPDIDMDFCKERREEVIQYVSTKYGKECVSQVITFGKIGGKSSVRDAARALSVPLYLADKIAKAIPEDPGMTLEKAYNASQSSWDQWFKDDYYVDKTWKGATTIAGFNRNLGVHAAGLIIGNVPIWKKAPLYTINDTQVVGFDGKYLEDFDLVKFDFLGLKTLTVIDNAFKLTQNTVKDVNLHDANIYKYISEGNNAGLFQIESPGMQDLAKRLKPSGFEDLTAMLALYRPGPMEAGMLDSFIERKHGREKIDYFFDEMEVALKPILEPTYGLIVYQEQVMQIVQAIAGFSLGEADLVRRAMGKKKIEEMEKISKDFADRAEIKGYNRGNAVKLFSLIEKFAGYGFNKSHSAAYAQVTVQTGHLKLYHPTEFMVSLINLDIDDTEKMATYISAAINMGIKVNKPDILKSQTLFTINEAKEIEFGLKGIKGVGNGSTGLQSVVKNSQDLKQILIEAQLDKEAELFSLGKKIDRVNIKINKNIAELSSLNQSLSNLSLSTIDNLTKREITQLNKLPGKIEVIQAILDDSNVILSDLMSQKRYIESINVAEKINKRVLEGIGMVGCFDSFGVTRKFIIDNIDNLTDHKKIETIDFNVKEEISLFEKVLIEKEKLGVIFTNPFPVLNIDIPEERPVVLFLEVTEARKKTGEKYNKISFLTIDNKIIEISDFNNKMAKFKLGDILTLQIAFNGRYINLVNVKKFSKNDYDEKVEVEVNTVLKVDILDTIPTNLKSYKSVEVYDNGKLVAIMR